MFIKIILYKIISTALTVFGAIHGLCISDMLNMGC